MSTLTPAIRFEPDGYETSRSWLMGRHVAGHGFLRAAVAAAGGAPVPGFGPSPKGAKPFAELVARIDPAARTRWFRSGDLDALSAAGVAYLPYPAFGAEARLRLRAGPARYSLVGVTHTTATAETMDGLAAVYREPLTPWDAVICTSQAVLETLRRVHEAEADYLHWRFGADLRLTAPQLPVIPLGVHCADFEFTADQKAQARASLDIAEDEVVALFVGRLAFHAKVHPAAMYRGLQAAAERTGKRLVLVETGWAPHQAMADAYVAGAKALAPDVRHITLDGREPDNQRRSWACADLFVSLSDNIQETFGLTPIEAMAAGLPVVVTDWDGYRDNIQDGVHGFLVPTFAPAAGFGSGAAADYESGLLNYDNYLWRAVALTSVDLTVLADRLSALVENADLRRRLGDAARAHARANLDWSVIFRRYQDLFADLDARRRSAVQDPQTAAWLQAAPSRHSSRLDPFEAFGHYPTRTLRPDTRVAPVPGATLDVYRTLAAHPLFPTLPVDLRVVQAVLGTNPEPATVSAIAERSGVPLSSALMTVAALGKMGLVRLDVATDGASS